jgi:hypothetical protein
MEPTVTLNGIVYVGCYPVQGAGAPVQPGTIILGSLPRWGEPLNAQLYVDDKDAWRNLLIDFDTNPHTVPDLSTIRHDLAQPVYTLLQAYVMSLIQLREVPVRAVYSTSRSVYLFEDRDLELEALLTPVIDHLVTLAASY